MRAVPDAPPTNMSAFTVSAVAAPGAAKFASRNANARRPAAAPARVVRRAGRVAQQVVAKAGPSGEVKKVRAMTRSGTAAVRSKTRVFDRARRPRSPSARRGSARADADPFTSPDRDRNDDETVFFARCRRHTATLECE